MDPWFVLILRIFRQYRPKHAKRRHNISVRPAAARAGPPDSCRRDLADDASLFQRTSPWRQSATTLAFLVGAKQAFAARVMLPAVTMSERSYMRASLADMADEIRDELAAAAIVAVQ